jgi:hypothetical protein
LPVSEEVRMNSPPRLEFEVEVLRGEEGRKLRLEQARAIRNLLLWVHGQLDKSSSERIVGQMPDKAAN